VQKILADDNYLLTFSKISSIDRKENYEYTENKEK